MSYDLAVWYSATPLTVATAQHEFELLDVTDPDDPAGVPKAEAFYRDLVAVHADLPDLADDAAEESPWTAGITTGPGYVWMAVSWGRRADVKQLVLELCERHDLVCFDPQGPEVVNPPSSRPESGRTLSTCDGSVVNDPAPADVSRALATLSERNWYAILETAPEFYLQAGFGTQAGVAEGSLAVECRLGSAAEHFTCTVTDLWRVLRAFEAFLARPELPEGESWQRLTL